MKTIKTMAIALLALVSFAPAAKAQKKADIYAFGVAASFTDSIVYITDVQKISGVTLAPRTSFLTNRELYSQQLKNYVESTQFLPDRTCALFYGKNRRRLEKKMAKLSKEYQEESNLIVRSLTAADFQFKAVEPTVASSH